MTDGGFITIASPAFGIPETITTKLLDALLNGGNIVSLGNGGVTWHRPNAVLDNTGETIDFTSGAFQNLVLDGVFISGGSLITGPGGIINSAGGPDVTLANVLHSVTILGDLTLQPGNSLQLAGCTTSGAITIDSSAYLFMSGAYTLENLTLNGGNLEPGASIDFPFAAVTIAPDGLAQGYGEIGSSSADFPMTMLLENEGTINSDIAGQLLNIRNTSAFSFVNDGLLEATNGGNISIDFINNNADGVISVANGSTLQLGNNPDFGGAVNSGLIKVGGAISGAATLHDDGQIRLEGGSIDVSSLTIAAGGELSGFGAVANAIESSGVINARDGKMDIAGPVTGDGHFLISQAATLELGDPTAQAVTFEPGGSGDTLYLDKTSEFSGTVAGLAQGDAIDLADFAFSAHPIITNITGTGAAGSTTDVTIADGSLTTTVHLLNQYEGEYSTAATAYTLESDNPGSANAGTLFTTAALTAVGTNITGTEGSSTGTIPVATLTDANPNAAASDFTATIDWGDGATTTGNVVAQNGDGFAVDGAHTYAEEGKYTVGVTVNDVGGSTTSATSNANIADAALTASGTNVSGTEGATTDTVTVATFTDANPNATASDFTATINWGDGTTTTGTIVAQSGGGFAVDGTHTYADEGKYAVSTTINDVGGSTTSTTSNANIADAPLTATGLGITGTEDVTTGTVTVATFTDGNPIATAIDFTAAIDWGDGTSTAGTVVAQSGGGFAVEGSHSYAKDGKYTLGIKIDDIGGSSTSAISTASVSGPQVKLTIDPVDGNNVINHAEAHAVGGVSITGKETSLSSGATFVVSVADGSFSKDYTATVKGNGSMGCNDTFRRRGDFAEWHGNSHCTGGFGPSV